MFFTILSYALIPLTVGLLTPAIVSLIVRHNIKKEIRMNRNSFSIEFLPLWLCFLLVSVVLFLSVLTFLLYRFGVMSWYHLIIITPLIAFFALGIFVSARQKLIVKNDKIIYTPAFGKSNVYTFSQILFVQKTVTSKVIGYAVFTKDKRIFSISNTQAGAQLFIQKIEKLQIQIKTIIK